MAIEVLSRLKLPIAPVDPEDVARLADLPLSGGQAHYGADPPPTPLPGMFWATPSAQLFVWTGTVWLRLVPPTADWDTGNTGAPFNWDDGTSVWS